MPNSIDSPEVRFALEMAFRAGKKTVKVGRDPVEFSTPFPSPADWGDHWVYLILLDRFNNPQAPPRNTPWDEEFGMFQGGTFEGVRQKLDYLKQLGTGALWLTPILKNCQYDPHTYHGYGIQDFLRIEPRFASDPRRAKADPGFVEREFQHLVDAAHARGMYVILDIVLNHTGDVFEYVLNDGDPAAEVGWTPVPHPVRWRDDAGHGHPEWSSPPVNAPEDAAVLPVELRRNAFFRRQGRGNALAGDFGSLKGLVTSLEVHGEQEAVPSPLCDVLTRAYQYLIAKYDVDGFRIDTLKHVDPAFAEVFAKAVRKFAVDIGKENFFIFGEVYDEEETIARFVNPERSLDGEVRGVDAALDFPLFFKLPAVAKGLAPPSELIRVYERRKEIRHGEADEAHRSFVTFLDNHDQTGRFFFSPPEDPSCFADQLTLGLGCLFSLQGIPCLYYGTEQALHGLGHCDLAVREALWGKPGAFDPRHPFYRAIQEIARIRRDLPHLRHGELYFRPVSPDGVHFGISRQCPGVLAYSRILEENEVIVVANTHTSIGWTGEVIVDSALNPAGSVFETVFSNKDLKGESDLPRQAWSPVVEKQAGAVQIHEVNGALSTGPARAIRVALRKMEVRIMKRRV